MTAPFFPSSTEPVLKRSSSGRKQPRQPAGMGSNRSAPPEEQASTVHSTKDKDDLPYPAPSNISWRYQPQRSTPSSATHSSPLPRRLPQAHLSLRSFAMQASAAGSEVHSQPALVLGKRPLHLDLSTLSREGAVGGPASRFIQALSPIYERRSSTTSARRSSNAGDSPIPEPTTPASMGSTYSAFLLRPLRHSVSQASATSSIHTPATPTAPDFAPSLPPLDFPPLDLPHPDRMPIATVYEDSSSGRTGSFITANSEEGEHSELLPEMPPDILAPQLSASLTGRTLIDSYAAPSESAPDENGPEAELAPEFRVTSGDTFIMRRWGAVLSGVWDVHPHVQVKAAKERAADSRWPSRPAILFWLGFIAPFCWLIGGWLVPEGCWDMHHKPPARKPRRQGPQLPLWQSANGSFVDSLGNDVKMDEGYGRWWRAFWGTPRGPWLEKRGKRHQLQLPTDPWYVRWKEYAARSQLGDAPRRPLLRVLFCQGGTEAWVLRCRVAAVVSGVLLLVAFIVALAITVRLIKS